MSQSILVQIVEGESASPEDCSKLGKCVVRNLPKDLPAQTPIEVRFRYEQDGRLTVVVAVEGTGAVLKHELTRENSLTADQLDSWRRFISGVEPPPSTGDRSRQPVEAADASEADRDPPSKRWV